HLVETQINRIEERSAASRGRRENAALKILDTVGEATHELCSFVKTDKKELVLRVGSLEKLRGGFPGFIDFIGHAAAKVEDDADRNGYIFGGEILDFLLNAVFEDSEVVRLKPGDQAIVWVSDRNVDKRQVDINMDRLTRLDELAGCVMFHIV